MKKSLFIMCICLSAMLHAQVAKTVNVTTAGTLSTLLTANEKITITNLTITGKIDQRDFSIFYQGALKALKVIDLSNASIVAYATYPVNGIPNFAFYECKDLTSITIPLSVTTIGDYAFNSCTGLTSITIPSSVSTIGTSAFQGCTGLTSITIPSSVTNIGNYAFQGCTGLTSITIPSSITTIGEGMVTGCTSLTSFIIPATVTTIKPYAFQSCSSLTSITIPSSVTTIGESAFNTCSSLKSIAIPSSVSTIGNFAFENCTGLTSIVIPSSVTTIGRFAFSFCTGLTTITIPNSVKTIGYAALQSCTGLITIHAKNKTPVNLINSLNVFWLIPNTTCILYVPKGSKAAYAAADQWKDFVNIVEEDVVSTPTLENETSINIYPNPVQDAFTITGIKGNATVEVLSLEGTSVLSKDISENEPIQIAQLPSGMYIARISTASGTIEKKIVKQ